MSPRDVAIEITARYDTNNPFTIARKRNIGILYEPMKTTYGFYVRYRRFQHIILSDVLSEGMQQFVCAHELGHSILHADLNVPKLTRYTMFSRDKFEMQARTADLNDRQIHSPSSFFSLTICCVSMRTVLSTSSHNPLACRRSL